MSTSINWAQRATELRLDGRAVVDGQRLSAVDGQTFAKHSPIDGRLLTGVVRGQAADIDRAVRSARAAS
jgi:acyl-CoA reductase-like NAD-dependent aldehyde dehydrogenase